MTVTSPLLALHNAADSTRAEVSLSPGEAKKLRQNNHLHVADIASAVGVSESSVLRWEGARSKPRGFAAVRYARVLGHLAEAV